MHVSDVLEYQYFSYFDLPLIFLVFFFELLLSSDNAVIISSLARKVDEEKRSFALYTGIFSGLLLRLVALIFAVYLFTIRWIQIIAGIYLLFIMIKTLIREKTKNTPITPSSLWKIIIFIELYDILFAVDSIAAAYGLASIYYPFALIPHKIWVIYLGGVFSIFTIRMVSQKLMRFIDRHPILERISFFLVGWIGVKLIVEGIVNFWSYPYLKQFLDFFFWVGSVTLIMLGILTVKRGKTSKNHEHNIKKK